MDFDTQAGLIYSTLSDNEKDMIQYIRNHKSDVVGMPINELAKVLLSSKSSVLRLAQKLGYTGYSELKYSLKKDIVKKAVVPTDLVEKFRKEIDKTFEYASQVNFATLISEIHKARQVILYATGLLRITIQNSSLVSYLCQGVQIILYLVKLISKLSLTPLQVMIL